MTRSAVVERPTLSGPPLLGRREPRVRSVPGFAVSVGEDVCEFAAAAGLVLDGWQQDVMAGSMGLRPSGTWAARHVGLLVPRQNGKGSILEARELYGLFASSEQLIIHSAHKYDTSQKHFGRILDLIEGNPDLDRHIKRLNRVAGKESVELKDGSLLQFKARTISGSARGFTGDLVVLDEAMYLPEEAVDAMLPTTSAVPNPQTWVTSSAGNKASGFLWRVVQRGRGGHPSMAYFEWGTPADADVTDRAVWAEANPALGVDRPNALQMEALEDDFDLMSPEGFAREHLGVWDDPGTGLVDPKRWAELADGMSEPREPFAYGLDVSVDREWSTLAIAGYRPDGAVHVAVQHPARGTEWVTAACKDLAGKYPGARFVLDRSGPVVSLLPELRAAGLSVVELSAPDVRKACGLFVDAVTQGTLRHRAQQVLTKAAEGAKPRPLGDGGFAFGRKASAVDISPLNAACWAHYATVLAGPGDVSQEFA